ncbi:MAG: hypothetical protein ACI81T_001716 [Bacteroidia bacterium]|jgi:hypothetical protein
MRKLKILFFLAFLFVGFSAKADQLAFISKAQAEATVKYLNEKKPSEIMFWCACCDNDERYVYDFVSASFEHTGTDDYYQVVITFNDEKGMERQKKVDLAYVHLKKGNKAKCLGTLMNYECSPCTEPFDWNN